MGSGERNRADDQEQSDWEPWNDSEKLEVVGEGDLSQNGDKEKSECSVRMKEETEADMNCRVEILKKLRYQHNQILTTKLCRAISHALSNESSDKLIELDRLRQEIKHCGLSIVPSAKDHYRKLLSTFKR